MHVDRNIISRLQRARGCLELGFENKKGSNCLVHLHQSGCLKALIPKNYADIPDVVMINTSGGITGEDELQVKAKIGDKGHVCIATQTAERIYKSARGFGESTVELVLGKTARLDWLPQETILFNKSAFKRSMNVRMDKTAYLFMLETVVLGRQAMRETVTENLFLDQWQIKRNEEVVYLEALNLSNANELCGVAALGSNKAVSTILYVAPDAESRLPQMRGILKNCDTVNAASAWNGKLVVRLASERPELLRKNLIMIVTEFRGVSCPRVWLM